MRTINIPSQLIKYETKVSHPEEGCKTAAYLEGI